MKSSWMEPVRLVGYGGGNDVTGNDEKDINAKEASRQQVMPEVMGNDRQHSNGTQAVDLRSVVRRCGRAQFVTPQKCFVASAVTAYRSGLLTIAVPMHLPRVAS